MGFNLILLFVVCFGMTPILGRSSISMDMDNMVDIDGMEDMVAMKTLTKSTHEDFGLDIVHLIRKYNYPVETHYVTTEDGYNLEFFRIPHDPNSKKPNPKPVLFMHGLMGQPENFVTIMNISLARYFVDRGYDAWLGSTRGGHHGRDHIKLNPSDTKFWNYSIHEIATNDLPSIIDYVLEKTGKSKLTYVGHSQGGTVFYIMCTMMPEYQEKIATASLLAPAGFMKNVKKSNPLLAVASAFGSLLFEPARIIPCNLFHEFPSDSLYGISKLVLRAILGFSSLITEDNGESDATYSGMFRQFMGTVSVKQILHFAQFINSEHFRPWDYGKKGNREIYGKDEPDDYPVETIKVPTAFYYSEGDALVSAKDVRDMCGAIQNCIRNYSMPNREWGHLNFVTSKHANEAINKPLFEFADKYSRKNRLFD